MKTIAAIPFYFCFALLALLCFSCTSLHKLITKRHERIDSTQVITVDSSAKKGIDTTKTSTFNMHHSNSVVIDLDIDTARPPVYVITYDRSTGTITSTQPIKKAVISDDSDMTRTSKAAGIDTSSTKLNKRDSTSKKATITTVDKKVNKTSLFPMWWLLLLLIVPIYLIYKNRSKLWAWIITVLPI